MLLTLVDLTEGTVAPSSAAALTLAGRLDERIEAVVFAAGDEPVTELAEYGVRRIHRIVLSDYSPEEWGVALTQLIDHTAPDGVVAAASDRGNEVMAQAAARSQRPLATNCVTVEPGEQWRLTRIRAAGMLLEDAELSADVKLVTVMATAVEPQTFDASDSAVDVTEFVPRLEGLNCSRIVERAARGEGVGLATARVVVSGGRGVGSAEGFASLEELATLLGGAVGCSRVATNNGWRPHADQVGQTGTKVNPDLYIACGISGATQHWVGCMDAKTILAVNIDPEAPMVTRADYAVIGDVQQVLAAVIEEVLRRRLGINWTYGSQPAIGSVDSEGVDSQDQIPASGQVQSVARAVTILEFLASNEWSGVTELGKELGVHKSTAFRLLNTLESRGLVEQHIESGKYRLGFGLVYLANSVTHGHDINRQAQPGCQWLARQTEETVTLAILEGDEAVTIDQIMSTSTVASRSWLGRRMPLHCTSQGKIFLAYASEVERTELVAGDHERFTEFTIVDQGELAGELIKVREQGYATTVEEFEAGLSALSAPVCAADGEVVASIGISGPSYRLDSARLAELAPLVTEAAARASVGYGHSQLDNFSHD